MTLKHFAIHQFREIQREYLIVLEGLTPEDLTTMEPGTNAPIAWIVEHCLANIDHFINYRVTGEFRVWHEDRFTAWPIIPPEPGAPYPSLGELVERWNAVLDAAVSTLSAAPNEVFAVSKHDERGREPLAESCLRAINHQNSHLRQIWCILGKRGTAGFPDQSHWLA